MSETHILQSKKSVNLNDGNEYVIVVLYRADGMWLATAYNGTVTIGPIPEKREARTFYDQDHAIKFLRHLGDVDANGLLLDSFHRLMPIPAMGPLMEKSAHFRTEDMDRGGLIVVQGEDFGRRGVGNPMLDPIEDKGPRITKH